MSEQTPIYVIGAINGKDDSSNVMDINPIVESPWQLDGSDIKTGDAVKYSSSSIMKACIDYMATVPFMHVGTTAPNNHHVGLWVDTNPEKTKRNFTKPEPTN